MKKQSFIWLYYVRSRLKIAVWCKRGQTSKERVSRREQLLPRVGHDEAEMCRQKPTRGKIGEIVLSPGQ